MARGWTPGAGCLGKQREKMGSKWREGKEGGAMPLEQERRGGWEGQRHEHGGDRGELGSLSQPMCALGTLPLWGPHLAGLRAVADKDFPFGVCPFLVPPTPPPLISPSTPLSLPWLPLCSSILL